MNNEVEGTPRERGVTNEFGANFQFLVLRDITSFTFMHCALHFLRIVTTFSIFALSLEDFTL